MNLRISKILFLSIADPSNICYDSVTVNRITSRFSQVLYRKVSDTALVCRARGPVCRRAPFISVIGAGRPAGPRTVAARSLGYYCFAKALATDLPTCVSVWSRFDVPLRSFIFVIGAYAVAARSDGLLNVCVKNYLKFFVTVSVCKVQEIKTQTELRLLIKKKKVIVDHTWSTIRLGSKVTKLY